MGSLLFSLDDIEHGILRCNTPPPGASDSPFDASDERKPLSLTRLDPRLHFALNCGARSCPPIKVWPLPNDNFPLIMELMLTTTTMTTLLLLLGRRRMLLQQL